MADPERIQKTVPEGTGPVRLDRALADLLPQFSRVQLTRWIREGRVRVDGRELKPSEKVAAGQVIELEAPPAEPRAARPEAIDLKILHEDDWLIVLDKPAGLTVHPAPGHAGGTLVNALLNHTSKLSSVAGPEKPGIVHRLDKDTSGLMVVAKDNETHLDLSRQFSQRKVDRVYWAAVRGVIQPEEGTIRAALARDPANRKRITVRPGGREAITHYRVLERFRGATAVELTLETGRTHQLRVHMKHLGHPVLGDTHYGVMTAAKGAGQVRFGRQALHASQLSFDHPGLKRRMSFTSELPADLVRTVEWLRQASA
ncbi:MAG: RluA family pseudouridine synthase [Candidatus Omnitrophica bacterium CG11_big_fil_rev_8_21_14_0_20_64_10]|nr:MAG: RluA family pseudouridine synthase [Candidatus Omnitrophica bacterium CG11_big_fil_rev_8_21_14_0_20_64_10]